MLVKSWLGKMGCRTWHSSCSQLYVPVAGCKEVLTCP